MKPMLAFVALVAACTVPEVRSEAPAPLGMPLVVVEESEGAPASYVSRKLNAARPALATCHGAGGKVRVRVTILEHVPSANVDSGTDAACIQEALAPPLDDLASSPGLRTSGFTGQIRIEW